MTNDPDETMETPAINPAPEDKLDRDASLSADPAMPPDDPENLARNPQSPVIPDTTDRRPFRLLERAFHDGVLRMAGEIVWLLPHEVGPHHQALSEEEYESGVVDEPPPGPVLTRAPTPMLTAASPDKPGVDVLKRDEDAHDEHDSGFDHDHPADHV